MKLEHLEERIQEYKNSIQTVVEKRILWNGTTRELIINVFKKAEELYNIGWKVQELNWIHTNQAINITFDSFPPELIEKTNCIPTFQFLQGGSLVFSQMHNGDINVFILFPIPEKSMGVESEMEELGTYIPKDITEKLVVEKIDEFLKNMIQWEVPLLNTKVGFNQSTKV